MKRVFRRPSPAMVVAIVALIAALGGSAIAGVATVSVLSKKDKKKVKNIAKNQANNQITARAPGLSVGSAGTANNLADQSQQIRAWASLDNDVNGTVLASKNVNSVVKDGTGRYCFDLPFTPNTAVATIDASQGNFTNRILTQVNDTALCPAGNRDVRVYIDNGAADANAGFFIHIN
jgi:hypothetical protein